MVARAKASTWFNLVAGLVVGATAQPLFVRAAPDTTSPVDPQTAPEVARPAAGSTLGAAAEAIRNGDYDTAASLLQRASAESADGRDLARLRDALAVAVQARRAGAEQIHMAEEAVKQGNEARAAELLRRLRANEPYLTAEDHVRLDRLSQTVRGQAPAPGDKQVLGDKPAPGSASVAAPGGALATAQARAKLQQARSQMAQFNFERTEQLAHEAERLQPKLSANEDSPKKVLDDLARVRTDPKALLTAARVALGRKDYDRAEQFARLSEKNSGPFTFPFWGDSPSRVLRDVQDLRPHTTPAVAATKPPAASTPAKPAPANNTAVVTASATAPATPPAPAPAPAPAAALAAAPAKPAADPTKPAPGSPEATVQAANLIKQARTALAAGDVTKAKKLNDQARMLKPNLHWWDDNPEKLAADIARAEPKTKPAVTQVAAKSPPVNPVDKNKPLTKEEAVALIKKGRALLAEDKIDEASQACLKARLSTSISWGLFEDSPEKLRQDIEKVRVRRDREESVKVLAEARRLYEAGKYDEASKAAYRAQKLHGAYNIWELGDRPERVLADIQTAKIRIAKGQPVGDVKKDVKDAPSKPADAVTQAPKPGPTPASDPRQAQARKTLAEARVALKAGDTPRAVALAEQVKAMHVVLAAPGDDSPEAVLKDVERANASRVSVTVQASPVIDNKARALQLLAEARELRKAQKLLEARAKVLEADQLHASFGPGEESPELVLQNLAAEARWQVEWYVREAVRVTGTTGPDMSRRYQNAERALVQARTLAVGFGLDVAPIESQLVRMHAQQAVARGEAAPSATAVAAAPTKTPGQDLLEKARLEIQRGQTENARKLAEEATQPSYGVQAEAFAVLRSIGAEEVNQRRLQSYRTFDAALAAYNRRDFANAANLIQSIDPNGLDESRRARLREIAMTPEMRPAGQPALTQVQAVGEGGLPNVPSPGSVQSGVPGGAPTLGEQPGVARADDRSSADPLLAQTEAMRQVKFQKLRQEGQEVQREASEKFRTGQTDAAIEMLQEYLAQLNDAQLELGQVALLKRQPEARLQQFKLLKAQRDFLNEQDGQVRRKQEEKTREVLYEESKEKKVAELMKQYNTFYAEGKYPEAERLAMQAHELDPDNPMASAAISIVRTQARLAKYKKMNEDKDALALETLDDTDNLGPPGVDDNGIVFDKKRSAETLQRLKKYPANFTAGTKSEKDKEIERRMLAPVTLNFTDTPLKSVIDDLRAWQGINIYVDTNALEAEGISLDRPVTIKLEQIPMKFALNLLLKGVHLTWVVRDSVLQITTPRNAKGSLATSTYQVADLVIPVTDFGQLPTPGGQQTAGITVDMRPNASQGSATTPNVNVRSLTTGESVGSPTGSPFGTDGRQPQTKETKSGPANTTEDKLIALIKSVVAPESWTDSGGPGNIDYFPLSMTLVINQTPDIQEQVADLLSALRRLQDQEVAIEIRFITIDDSFFERIGVDFNMNIQTKNTRIQPTLTSGTFTPDGYINAFAPKNTVVGIQPTGTFTPDLNIPITTQTYTQAVPDFGGYQGTPGFGGLTVGLAFLSDIQVFLFLEAVQGDVRTNVMQAPKLSLFNGQTSTITVTTSQNFVTGAQVGNTGGQYTFTPVTQQFPFGIQLTMQGVISADRRFVRMSLAPTLTNLSSTNVNLFPVVVPIFPQLDGSAFGQPVVFTQYIQQPIVSTVMVMTTVAVPDGGTVLMGGLKLLSEERKEYGPPILSKIPYLSRLFKNTSYGRDASSLLIMVTPRIIIQEEEEFKQTGYERPVEPVY
jgi:type II secretory pathway component GspD/PulD (secretin)/tetratricopeptide (TPR) repeat protein